MRIFARSSWFCPMTKIKGLTMFNPILVPLDGSLLAECVLPHVIAISQVFDAKIILLQVLDKNPADVSNQFIDLLNWQLNKTEAMLYLKRIDDQLRNSALHTKINILEGPAAESIIEFARNQQMKLIILSSHGQSGLRKWGISSTTHKIIFSAPTSLLIIRASQPKEQPYRRILVPLDGSWRAENVLPIVTLLARFHKSEIQIVHVVKTPEMARHLPPVREDVDLSHRIVERNQEEALNYLDQLQLHSSLVGVDVKTHLIVSNDVTRAIHELVYREQIDLVALSAHGYTGNNLWPYGNMVNNFILFGKVPLLIVQDLPVKEETNMEEKSQVHVRIKEHSMH
jgi:nucleotide-binding universal stress UspA family protein